MSHILQKKHYFIGKLTTNLIRKGSKLKKEIKTQGKNSKLKEKTQNSGKKLNVSEDCPSLDLPSGVKKEPSNGFWLVFGIMGSGGGTFKDLVKFERELPSSLAHSELPTIHTCNLTRPWPIIFRA